MRNFLLVHLVRMLSGTKSECLLPKIQINKPLLDQHRFDEQQSTTKYAGAYQATILRAHFQSYGQAIAACSLPVGLTLYSRRLIRKMSLRFYVP